MRDTNKISYVFKTYPSPEKFLEEVGPHLHKDERYNSIFICQLETEVKNQSHCYFSAVWEEGSNTLIFANMALKDSFLYGSSIPEKFDAIADSVVDAAMQSVLEKGFPSTSIHAYEPVITKMKESIEKVCPDKKPRFIDQCHGVSADKVEWSDRNLENKDKTYLRVARIDELLTVMEWFETYEREIAEDEAYLMYGKIEPLCRDNIEKQAVYYLCSKENDEPLAMAWKSRPLLNSCSISHVYAPQQYRGHGFASTCVSMLTELLLEEYTFVTLFTSGERHPETTKNLYTGVGYKYFETAKRYAFSPIE